MLPSNASSRKQIRQRLKSRIKPRGRPHLKQRRTTREANFGGRFALMIIDFFAMQLLLLFDCQNPFSLHLRQRLRTDTVKLRRAREWLGALHRSLAALSYGTPLRDLLLTIFQAKARNQAKNKAPCEAHEIYAKWGRKSNFCAKMIMLVRRSTWETSEA